MSASTVRMRQDGYSFSLLCPEKINCINSIYLNLMRCVSVSIDFFKIKQKKHLMAVVLSVVSVSGCELFDNDDPTPTPTPTTSPTPTPDNSVSPLSVRAFDPSNNDAPVENVSIVLNEGDNDFFTDEQENTVAENGFATFSFKDNTTIDDIADKRVAISFKAENYVSTSTTFVYPSTNEEDFLVEVAMIGSENQPEGVELVEEVVSTASGKLVQELTISTPPAPEGEVANSATVSIDTNTAMLDAAGEPIEGDVSVKVTSFSAGVDSVDSLTSFPGGFNAIIGNPADLDGVVENADGVISADGELEFISAGFVSVEMTDANGSAVKDFENGTLKAEIQIPASTINPNTGSAVQPGEQIPIWSFDVDKGEWQFEKNATESVVITAASEGFLNVAYEVDHLSYWNLDYFGTNSCDSNITLNIVDQNGAPYSDPLRGVVAYANGGWARRFYYRGDGSITFLRAPGGQNLVFKFFNPLNNTAVCSPNEAVCDRKTTFATNEFCSIDGQQIQLQAPVVETTNKELTVRAQFVCSNNPSAAPVPLDRITYYLAQENPRYTLIDFNQTVIGSSFTKDLPHTISAGGAVTEVLYHIGVVNPITRRQEEKRKVDLDNSPIIFEFSRECDTGTGATGGNGTGGSTGG